MTYANQHTPWMPGKRLIDVRDLLTHPTVKPDNVMKVEGALKTLSESARIADIALFNLTRVHNK